MKSRMENQGAMVGFDVDIHGVVSRYRRKVNFRGKLFVNFVGILAVLGLITVMGLTLAYIHDLGIFQRFFRA
ncbi:hypothetical protein ACFL54_02030 [Planctomycetota bacterium]